MIKVIFFLYNKLRYLLLPFFKNHFYFLKYNYEHLNIDSNFFLFMIIYYISRCDKGSVLASSILCLGVRLVNGFVLAVCFTSASSLRRRVCFTFSGQKPLFLCSLFISSSQSMWIGWILLQRQIYRSIDLLYRSIGLQIYSIDLLKACLPFGPS